MSFGRQKRLLLGCLALLAPLPLPFNDVVGWPAMLLYWAAVGVFLARSAADASGWLPNWALNLLALAYLPLLWLDLTLFWRDRLLQPLAHLAMFTLVAKLFSLRREKDKWHALLGTFFLFVASMGTSVHPSVMLYLAAFLALALFALARFASFELFARHRLREEDSSIPMRGFLAGGVAFVLLVSIPLFALMPRLRSPYVMVRGGGESMSGVGDEQSLNLDAIGRIRTSRQVAMRFALEGNPRSRVEMRFRAAAFSRYENNTWRRGGAGPVAGAAMPVGRGPEGFIRVGTGRPRTWMRIWLQPLGGSGLVLPVNTAALDIAARGVLIDDGGAVSLFARPAGTVEYRVGLAGEESPEARPIQPWDPPSVGRRDAGADLSLSGVTPRIEELADRVAGEGSAQERARRLESHLIREYGYTLDLVGEVGANRVEDFLFRDRRGHCELFASALVLMLRSEGIPARLVSGFLGAEYNPLEGYYIVRQSNAHAWVEADLGGGRWTVLDPTPPAGRPGGADADLSQLAGQVWDFLLFRWDRYVLTYGFGDQVGMFWRLRSAWFALEDWFTFWDSDPASTDAAEAPAEESVAAAAEAPPASESPLGWIAFVLLLGLAAGWMLVRRPALTARRAYRRLRQRLQGVTDTPVDCLAPIEAAARLAVRFPQAEDAVARVVELYLLESFGERRLDELQSAELRVCYREARRRMRERRASRRAA